MKTKGYTSLEQSKKLLELGLSPESADMIWDLTNPDLPNIRAIPYEDSDYNNKYLNIVPAWSLAALLELMPNDKEFDICLSFGGYKGDEYIDEWFCAFEKETGDYIFEVKCGGSPIDAVFEMVCWLLENKYI